MKKVVTVVKYRPYAIRFLRRAKELTEEISTLSEGCRSELKKYYRLDSTVRYNLYQWKTEANIGLKKQYVLWAGRLSQEKNVHLLLEAWNKIAPNGWLLMLVGEGEEKAEIIEHIRQMGRNDIKMLGVLNREELFRLMAQTSIFVLTSFHEGFPTVVTEAMNMGNAVITTHYDGFSNELIDNSTAIVTGYKADEMSEALERLMNDRTMLEEMQKKAILRCRAFTAKVSKLASSFP